jgi:ATP synthase F1 gamma subunit
MAVSLSELKTKINATANVAKLTSVMKLVASSKLKGAEMRLENAKPFGASLLNSVSREEGERADGETKKRLVVVLTTDRGMCGSVNSSLVRWATAQTGEWVDAGDDVALFTLGDKGRVQFVREFAESADTTIDQCFDKDPIFPLASAIAERIVSKEFDCINLFYNEFESAAKFNSVMKSIPQVAGMPVGQLPDSLKGYGIEPENNEEALQNLMEYGVASSLFYVMLESSVCEISQRVTAMDNASTNAGEMVDRYTLQFNRARQAKITTELTEIISGAESIKEEADD